MAESATKVEPDVRTCADSIYTACLGKVEQPTWRQEDLLALDITRDVNALMPAVSLLMQENKLQPIQTEGNAAIFTVRGRSAASKYASIKDPVAIKIYRLIENAGPSGVWKQTLKKKLGLHEIVAEKALKALIGSKHIKQLKGARNTAKKTYILYELEPTTDVTGGAWFSEGELDYEFIEAASQLVVMHVRKNSWARGPMLPRRPTRKTVSKASNERGEKRKRDEKDDDAEPVAKRVDINGAKAHREEPQATVGAQERFDEFEEDVIRELRAAAATDRGRILVPFPPGYTGYPTATSIFDHVEASGVIMKDLSIKDIKELLDRLVYDGQLERIPLRQKSKLGVKYEESDDSEVEEVLERPSKTAGRSVSKRAGREGAVEDDDDDDTGYRWVRRSDSEWDGVGGDTYSFDLGMQMSRNGFSETPCSRCPVFKICTEGGPVDAASCEYLKDWF